MVAAVALRNENPVKHEPPTPSRDEVLARYRHLREISKRHHSKALDFLSAGAMLQHARRLGLAHGKTLMLDSIDELPWPSTWRSTPLPSAARGQSTATPDRHSLPRAPTRRSCSGPCAMHASQ